MQYFEFKVVVLARHFQHRVEVFFKEILLIRTEPIGKVKYYAIRLEFQFRSSPYIPSFLRIPNALTLNESSLHEYVDLLDPVLCGNLPSEQEDFHL